ncbi:hypothetical protein J4573_49850 [Actinomadura barringtoniae]|uniref:HEAT repeat domain-containing protein n=1 Tax=Actinomadura barringtoniae TaxID=1427535 RepID=A0A939PUY6_9ACTN|nr:hypothetical protein [Actinomadura barringtoniae]MBO2455266.1 hypothetical protein [Actinomadura barringtoniae]
MSQRRFDRAMQQLRQSDPQSRENGFDFLREHADSYIDELIAEFEGERDDHGLRCLLLELIAEARDEKALSILSGQLESLDESLQFWAVRGLEMLDTRDSETVLDKARANGWIA